MNNKDIKLGPLLIKVVSSLALPPVFVELYSISADICFHWVVQCFSNRGAVKSLKLQAERKGAIYRDSIAMWCLSMKTELVYFLPDQKQA